MRYLVIGGGGFIGSHLAAHLVTRGDQVTVLDCSSAPHRTAGADYVLGVAGREMAAALSELIIGHDAIFHLAATVGFANVLQSPGQTITNGLAASQVVFRVAARAGRRVLFTSTSAIYGRAQNGALAREDGDGIMGLTSTPSWSYAYSKAAEEVLGFAEHREHGLPLIVARLFNTVGARQSASAGFVLPRFVHAALENQPLHVHAPGTQTRTFAHVADVVEGLAKLMECDQAIGQVVNLGGTATITMQSLAEQVVAQTESHSEVQIVPDPYGAGYDNVMHRRPDLTKARRLIGYNPQRTLMAMIADVAEEYQTATP